MFEIIGTTLLGFVIIVAFCGIMFYIDKKTNKKAGEYLFNGLCITLIVVVCYIAGYSVFHLQIP